MLGAKNGYHRERCPYKRPCNSKITWDIYPIKKILGSMKLAAKYPLFSNDLDAILKHGPNRLGSSNLPFAIVLFNIAALLSYKRGKK